MLLGLICHGRIQRPTCMYCLRRTQKFHCKFSKLSKIIN